MAEKTTSSSNTKKRRTYEQELTDKARNMNEAFELEYCALQNILNDALYRDAYLDWDSMIRSPHDILFKNEPVLKDYVPKTPDDTDNMQAGLKTHFEQQYAEGERKYLAAKADHDERIRDRRARVNRRNRNIKRLKKSFLSGRPRAVKSYFNRVLHASEYPSSFPKQYSLDYTPEPRHLIVEYELPGVDIVPEVKNHRDTRKRNRITQNPLVRQYCIQLSGSVIAQVALRTIHEIFQADRTKKVDLIWFKGYVKVTDQITHLVRQLPVVGIRITRRQFLDINLRRVDLVECLKGLDSEFSRRLDFLTTLSFM